jgi:hypothetical protein
MVTKKFGFVSSLIKLASSTNRAVRFGVIKILENLTRSSADRARDYNEEMSKLRKVAAKGLGPDKSEELAKISGSPALVKTVTRCLVEAGAVRALVKCVQTCNADKTEDSEEKTDVRKKQTHSGMGIPMIEAISKCLKKMAADEYNRGFMVQQKGLRLLRDL